MWLARLTEMGLLRASLMRRPYDLRHSGVTWRLNSGVPATEVAARAGHSVEVLMRVYARCVTGLEDVWISRMDGALRLTTAARTRGRRNDRGRVLGAESGRRRPPVARAVSACHPGIPASCQVSARLPRI